MQTIVKELQYLGSRKESTTEASSNDVWQQNDEDCYGTFLTNLR